MSQDLNGVYIKHMRHHGCGVAMFQPIAFADMKPPCCGYFDRNGKWNLIARLSAGSQDSSLAPGLRPLQREPAPMRRIGVKWQPKCSSGVRMWNVDISGKSPNFGVPIGADAHIKYQSKKRFGAVLIAKNPVTVTAINDECLFKDWVEANKAYLYSHFGRELKKYGMWVVTLTFAAPECSINVWLDKDKEALLSAKAKASMVGDYGAELDWTDHINDKDWSHFSGDPTKWSQKTTNQAQSGPVTSPQVPRRRSGTQQYDQNSPHNELDISHTQAPKTPTAATESKPPPSPDGQFTRRLSRKAALSPINDRTGSRHSQKDGRDGTADRSPPTSGTTALEQENVRKAFCSPRDPIENKSKQASQCTPAKNDGVVLFFDGLRIDQLEWWIEGFKSVTTALASPVLGKSDESPTGDQQRQHAQKLSGHPHNDQNFGWKAKGHQHQYIPLQSSPHYEEKDMSSSDEDYDPETDEGVLPTNWPRRSPSLVSGHSSRQSSGQRSCLRSDTQHDPPRYRNTDTQSFHVTPVSYREQNTYSG